MKPKKGSRYCTMCGKEVETKSKILEASSVRQIGEQFKRICSECDANLRSTYK